MIAAQPLQRAGFVFHGDSRRITGGTYGRCRIGIGRQDRSARRTQATPLLRYSNCGQFRSL
jgi:hypothetical protein